jgi:hypothetical protein
MYYIVYGCGQSDVRKRTIYDGRFYDARFLVRPTGKLTQAPFCKTSTGLVKAALVAS